MRLQVLEPSKNQIELQILELYKIVRLQVLEPSKNQIELQILELYRIVRLQNCHLLLYLNLHAIDLFSFGRQEVHRSLSLSARFMFSTYGL